MKVTDFHKDDIVRTFLGEVGYIMVEPKPSHFNLSVYFLSPSGSPFGGTHQSHTPDSLTKLGRIGKRSPRGYHIERWADGIYHVYYGGDCIEESRTKYGALITAWLHRARRP